MMAEKEDRDLEAWEVQRGRGAPSRRETSAAKPAAAPQYLTEHTVAEGETLSHIALKYYGSAAREKWMAIYEANKAVIGDNPNLIRIGQVLKIPKLS